MSSENRLMIPNPLDSEGSPALQLELKLLLLQSPQAVHYPIVLFD